MVALADFPEGSARAFVTAIREFDDPAWRDDPKVTPDWVGRVLALAPGVDAASVARRAAAWWVENPARTRERVSCTSTLRTFFNREPKAGASRALQGPVTTGAAAKARAELEDAQRERALRSVAVAPGVPR